MKRLLMIVPFFPPMAGGGIYRPLSFVKYLPRFGWNTTVLAPRGDTYWLQDERLLSQVPSDCEVVRTATLSGQSILSALRAGRPGGQKRSSRRFGFARRLGSAVLLPDTYVGWYPFALRGARRLVATGHFDAIYSTSPPETSHLIAGRLFHSTGLPWLADFRDPWMNLHLLRPPSRLHALVHRSMERSVCRRAQVVVATSWQEEDLHRRYPGANVTRISNGYDGEEVSSVAGHRPPSKPFRILHAGMLTQQRSALPFLQGLRSFLDRTPGAVECTEVTFLGPREDENDAAVARLNLSGIVRFADSQPHDEALRLQRESHVLLLIKHMDPTYDGLVPGKLYEYMGLGRPVLALVPAGEACHYVESMNRGLTAPGGDVSAISQCIEKLYRLFANGTLESSFSLEPPLQFERSTLAGRLAGVLDSMVGGA